MPPPYTPPYTPGVCTVPVMPLFLPVLGAVAVQRCSGAVQSRCHGVVAMLLFLTWALFF